MRAVRLPVLLLFALLLAALAPAGAAAETRTYINNEGFGPSEGAGTAGPATVFPGTVEVSGVAGTVTRVTVTVFDLSADSELDMALVGPNGAQVMLMSDACQTENARRVDWTFEDDAVLSVPTKICPLGGREGVRPTDINTGVDNFTEDGPEGPFGTSLSAFDGISPNGDWDVYMIDDNPAERVAFEMTGFALNLEIAPPPPAAPVVQTVLVPGPTVFVPAPVAKPAATGKRAAALARCAKKKTAKERVACKAKARKLPV